MTSALSLTKSTQTAVTTQSTESSPSTPIKAIVGSVFGGLTLVSLTVGICFWYTFLRTGKDNSSITSSIFRQKQPAQGRDPKDLEKCVDEKCVDGKCVEDGRKRFELPVEVYPGEVNATREASELGGKECPHEADGSSNEGRLDEERLDEEH